MYSTYMPQANVQYPVYGRGALTLLCSALLLFLSVSGDLVCTFKILPLYDGAERAISI